jgi:hypothetical protein
MYSVQHYLIFINDMNERIAGDDHIIIINADYTTLIT